MRKPRTAPLLLPGLLAVGVLAARLTPMPALTTPTEASLPASLHLKAPVLYLVLGPWFSVWDGISMLSWSRLQGLLSGLAAAYLLWRLAQGLRRQLSGTPFSWRRELGILALTLSGFVAFVIAGALWHRPMLSLAGVPAEYSVVDFHTHTNLSHDVRGTWVQGFDREANRRWHYRAGFDAVFLTDHNVPYDSTASDRGHPALCPGIEVSAWRAHILLLGDSMPVDRRRYNHDFSALLDLLRNSELEYGALSVASLPEYFNNHWNRLDTLVTAGLDGFEIVNAAPKANELRRDQRDSVVALARAKNRFVIGVSDSHGWGATSMVWNLVRTSAREPGICAGVLGQLHTGFPGVRIVERHRLRPDAPWPPWLTPVGILWETWRSMGWPLTASWLGWLAIWIVLALRRGTLAKPSSDVHDSRGPSRN